MTPSPSAEYLYQIRGDAMASLKAFPQSALPEKKGTVTSTVAAAVATESIKSKSKKKAGRRSTRPNPSGSGSDHHKPESSSQAAAPPNNNTEGLLTPQGHNFALLTFLTSAFSTGSSINSASASTVPPDASASGAAGGTSSPLVFPSQLEQAYTLHCEKVNAATATSNVNIQIMDTTQLVLGHNLALWHLIHNHALAAIQVLLPLFESYSPILLDTNFEQEPPSPPPQEEAVKNKENEQATQINLKFDLCLGDLTSQVAFLLLDCILALGPLTPQHVKVSNQVLTFLERHISHFIKENNKQIMQTTSNDNNNNNNSSKMNTNTSMAMVATTPVAASPIEIQFRLSCYKSKTFLAYNPQEATQGQLDAKYRMARKELKSTMETYHHKLDPSRLDSGKNKRNGNNSGNGNSNGNSNGGASGSRADESELASVGSISYPDDGTAGSGAIGVGDGNGNGNGVSRIQGGPGGSGNIGSGSGGGTTATLSENPPLAATTTTTAFQRKRLQGQHQSALYLKAKLEYLKGNTDKAIRLCNEAQNSSDRHVTQHPFPGTRRARSTSTTMSVDESHGVDQASGASSGVDPDLAKGREVEFQHFGDLQAALYYNNLAIVHQTEGKVHLASHFYAIAIDHMAKIESSENLSEHSSSTIDGGALLKRLTMSQILYNAAICAQQGAYFKISYEAMARCVGSSEHFAKDPQCWLHMAESCIGIYAERCKQGCNRGLTDGSRVDGSSTTFGSPQDLDLVSTHPLSRAIDCLTQCLRFYNQSDEIELPSAVPEKMKRLSVLESARVSLAYVWLELNNLHSVIRISELVLGESPICAYKDGESAIDEKAEDPFECPASQKRRTTMRMYACESMRKLGTFSEKEVQSMCDNFSMNHVQANSFDVPKYCDGRRLMSGAVALKTARMESIS